MALWGHRVAIENVIVIQGVASFADLPLAEPPVPRTVYMENGRFVDRLSDLGAAIEIVDGEGAFLVPGLIDLQSNDFFGLESANDQPEMLRRFRSIAGSMLKEGVTSYVLTSLAMPFDNLLSYLTSVDVFRHREFDGVFENDASRMWSFDGQLIGAMVEGTYMNAKFRGCHNASYVHRLEDSSVWESELAQIVATGSVFAVNIAVDVNPSESWDAIRYLKNRKITVAIGHCQPTGAQLCRAVEAGVEYVIHLGNGSTGTSWKEFHRGGMLQEALRNDNLHVTIIADGFHVSKRVIRDWVSRKDLSRVSFVTDRAFAIESPERDFTVFGVSGRKEETDSGCFLRTYKPDDASLEEIMDPSSTASMTLFGAEVTMLKIFENVFSWFSAEMEGVNVRTHAGYDEVSALAIAVTTCCENPARIAKLDKIGRIEAGYISNACLLRRTPGRSFKVEKVFLGK